MNTPQVTWYSFTCVTDRQTEPVASPVLLQSNVLNME